MALKRMLEKHAKQLFAYEDVQTEQINCTSFSLTAFDLFLISNFHHSRVSTTSAHKHSLRSMLDDCRMYSYGGISLNAWKKARLVFSLAC